MLKHVKAPLALLAALALALLWTTPATAADDQEPTAAECLTTPAPEGCPDTVVKEIEEGLEEAVGTVAPTTDPPKDEAVPRPTDETPTTQAEKPAPTSAAARTLEAALAGEDGSGEGENGEGKTGEGSEDGDAGLSGSEDPAAAPDPAVVGTCVAGVVQQLIEDLEAALGDGVGDLVAAIEGALADPADPLASLEALLTDLSSMGQGTIEDITAEGETLLTTAAADIQECLPALPTEEPTPTPTPEPPAEPVEKPFTYANCDDARAHGAAPVYAGQYGYGTHLDSDHDGIGCEKDGHKAAPVAHTYETGKLAYTGFEVRTPLTAAGALLLAGGWLLTAARRRG